MFVFITPLTGSKFNQFYRLFTNSTMLKYDVPALETTAEPAARYEHTMTAMYGFLYLLFQRKVMEYKTIFFIIFRVGR